MRLSWGKSIFWRKSQCGGKSTKIPIETCTTLPETSCRRAQSSTIILTLGDYLSFPCTAPIARRDLGSTQHYSHSRKQRSRILELARTLSFMNPRFRFCRPRPRQMSLLAQVHTGDCGTWTSPLLLRGQKSVYSPTVCFPHQYSQQVLSRMDADNQGPTSTRSIQSSGQNIKHYCSIKRWGCANKSWPHPYKGPGTRAQLNKKQS